MDNDLLAPRWRTPAVGRAAAVLWVGIGMNGTEKADRIHGFSSAEHSKGEPWMS